jgi:hypothetical protein
MRKAYWLLVVVLSGVSHAASQSHVVDMGSWRSVTLASGQQIKVRPVVVDGRIKEFTIGDSHYVTETLFVIRRVLRLNDVLPGESTRSPKWTWQLDRWISVNRSTGHIAELNLPAFDVHNSDVSWYRDYAAYCGAAEDGSTHYMLIYQLGRRKPIMKKELYGQSCAAPQWEREPSRVTFEPPGSAKVSFIVHDSSAELETAH